MSADEEARERISRELFLQEQKADQLMIRFNALIGEARNRGDEWPTEIEYPDARQWHRLTTHRRRARLAAPAEETHGNIHKLLEQAAK